MNSSVKNLICVLIILLIGALNYLPRLSAIPFRGEEPRRVVSSFEMMQAKNWFVPTIQNEVFLSRPPMQNWVIAFTAKVRGSFDHLSGRLPSAICALLTALLIYYYCLASLPTSTALLASLFFLTMPQVLQLGRTAESELMFTLFLSGSFLLWHRGVLQSWRNYFKWSLAYLFLAFATLTKGINQAPVYFAAIVGINLIYTRRLKELWSLGHLFGLSIFLLIVGLWQWGFVHYVGAKTGWLMHAGDVALRFEDIGLKAYLKHGFVFPIELFAVMLPWSIFFLAYFNRSFRSLLIRSEERAMIIFCLSAIAITFLTVWIPPGARTRYYMPMFPCFAILAAIAAKSIFKPDFEKFSWSGKAFCYFFIRCCQVGIPLAGIAVFLLTFMEIKAIVPGESLYHAFIFLTASLALGAFLYKIKPWKIGVKFYPTVLCYALFAAACINLIYTDTRLMKSNDVEGQVLAGLKQLPKDTKLLSMGPVAFPFLYYYVLHKNMTIPVVSREYLFWKQKESDLYFCHNFNERYGDKITDLPWLTLSEVETNRFKKEFTKQAVQKVIIAKLAREKPPSP